jgi:peptidoglycan/LPS O-acetylase OafA/YrhL
MSNKIWFVQMLRAVACLLVCYSHLFGRNMSLMHALQNQNPLFLNLKILLHGNLRGAIFEINYGQISTGIFFLISGFVIPFSLSRQSSSSFLIQRFFRIYPVLFISLIISIIALYLVNGYLPKNFLVSFSLFGPMILGVREIIVVTWTLWMEVFFILISIIKNVTRPKTIIFTVLVLSVSSLAIVHSDMSGININLVRFLSVEKRFAHYASFMFIGTCFYNLYNNFWDKKLFVKMVTFLFSVHVFIFLQTASDMMILPAQIELLISYTASLVIFALCYRYRDKLKFSKSLYFLSNISYPLYLNHYLFGSLAIVMLLSSFPSIGPWAFILAVLFCIMLSALLHVFVEKPAMNFAKFVKKKFF